MVNFPASLDALVTLTSSTKMNDAGYEGDTLVNALNRIAEALEAKVGTGASTPTAGNILAATGTGTSAWASTIAINGSLTPGALSGTPTPHALYRGNVVKGWANFGNTGTVVDGFNVSSVTDNGTGDFTVNWDRDFANDDYAVSVTPADDTLYIGQCLFSSMAVGSARVQIKNTSFAVADPSRVMVIGIGNQ